MTDCKSCKENRQKLEPVPYIVHESAMAWQERTIKRLWILLILVISLLVATNGAWIVYESQFTDEVITVDQESETGYNNYIGNDGDITN